MTSEKGKRIGSAETLGAKGLLEPGQYVSVAQISAGLFGGEGRLPSDFGLERGWPAPFVAIDTCVFMNAFFGFDTATEVSMAVLELVRQEKIRMATSLGLWQEMKDNLEGRDPGQAAESIQELLGKSVWRRDLVVPRVESPGVGYRLSDVDLQLFALGHREDVELIVTWDRNLKRASLRAGVSAYTPFQLLGSKWLRRVERIWQVVAEVSGAAIV